MLLAQFDTDNLLQTIIAIVIIAGSVFGAIAKKLIKKFSPEEPAKANPLTDAAMPKKLGRRRQPQYPTAQPVRSTRQARSTPEAPVARPYPERPPIARPMPSAPPVARRSGPSQPVRPRKSPAEVQSGRPSVTTTTEERLGHLKPDLGHLASAIEGEEDRVRAQVETDLGHVETTIGPAVPTPRPSRKRQAGDPSHDREGADFSITSGLAEHLTNRGLRRAIVLSEIIGPPIALRQADERF